MFAGRRRTLTHTLEIPLPDSIRANIAHARQVPLKFRYCNNNLGIINLYGSYFLSVNGSSKVIPLKNSDVEDIQKWVDRLRSESGKKLEKNTRRWHTDNPSIQGTWTPFIHNSSCRLDIEEKAREKLGI